MARSLVFALLHLFWALGAAAAGAPLPVRRVTVSGNRALARSAFGLELEADRPFSESLLEADRGRILSRYEAGGFLWATVEADRIRAGDSLDVTFRITEGEPARIGPIRVAGNHAVATHVLSAKLPAKEGAFLESGVLADVQTLLRFYGDNGFPFCRVRPESLRLERPRVSLVLAIDEGPEVRLSDVRFTGRLETRPALLKRMLGLKLETPYSETQTAHRVARLASDPLLTIDGFEIRSTEGRYWLEVKAREAKSNRVSGAVAYSAFDHELAGMFDLNLDNLFGTRRAVDFNWQRNPGRQELEFAYTEPWLLNSAISLTATAHNRTRDSSFSATDLGIGGQTRVAEGFELRIEGGYSFVAAAESSLPSSTTGWAGSVLDYDTRDLRANPSQGVHVVIGERAGARIGSRPSTILHSQLDVEVVLPVLDRWGFAFGVHGRDVRAQDTLYSYDLFELGGASSLRGYREGQFLTPQCAWLNTELRYRTGRTARVYPFFDAALVQDPNTRSFGLYSGYGAGVRVESGLGLLGVDYGIRIGASPLQGKIHLSLQTGF